MAAHDLRRAINLLGSQKKPFLFAIDFAVREGWIWEEPLAQQEVLFRVGAYTNAPLTDELPPLPLLPLLVAHPLSEECYQGKFARIQEALSRGDSFLANLTISTPIETPLSLSEIFSRAEAPYKLMVPGRFVSFSPERFIRTQGGCKTIETNPMKGTIDAATPNAREHILQDYKETAEHYTIVDLMRNDLARVATNVRVEEFRYIDRVKTLQGELLQVSSRIAADLPPDASEHLGDILFTLLPAGSMEMVKAV